MASNVVYNLFKVHFQWLCRLNKSHISIIIRHRGDIASGKLPFHLDFSWAQKDHSIPQPVHHLFIPCHSGWQGTYSLHKMAHFSLHKASHPRKFTGDLSTAKETAFKFGISCIIPKYTRIQRSWRYTDYPESAIILIVVFQATITSTIVFSSDCDNYLVDSQNLPINHQKDFANAP